MRPAAIPFLMAAAVLATTALAADFPQWRGPRRDNRSADTGLLTAWPAGGPRLAWSAEGLGIGYSSPIVADGRVYLTGGEGGKGMLHCLDAAGNMQWKVQYGGEPARSYPGARNTPTLDDGLLYISSSLGDLVCLDARTGARRWGYNMLEKFAGENVKWSMCENHLIDGDRLILTPGGKHGLVAVHKKTGEEVWKSDLAMASSYCSPALVEHGGRKLLVTMMAGAFVGLDPATGKVLWKHPFRNRYGIHPNTPVYHEGILFNGAGYGYGGVGLKLSADGSSVTEAYKNKELAVHHGGLVLLDGHVYAAADGGLACMDMATGKTLWQDKAVGKGSLVWAEGLLYCYAEGGGKVNLVKATPKGHEVLGSFTVTRGSAQHWAHPVVADGKLFLRHGEVLLAYDIKAR